MSSRVLGGCILMTAVSACAVRGHSAGQPDPVVAGFEQQAESNRDRGLITHAELQSRDIVGLSVFDAVRTLRPEYLTVRGNHTIHQVNGTADTEAGKVHCSIDGGKVGPLDDLSFIRASTIKEIRYLDPAAAHHRFGGAAQEGPVILVTIL